MNQSADSKGADSASEPPGPGRALRLQAYGGPESLTIDRVSAPEPGPAAPAPGGDAAKLDDASIIAKSRPERMKNPKAADGFFKGTPPQRRGRP